MLNLANLERSYTQNVQPSLQKSCRCAKQDDGRNVICTKTMANNKANPHCCCN